MHLITTTPSQLSELAQKLESVPRFGLDFETTSSHPAKKAPLQHDKLRVVGYGIGFPDGEKTYVPLAHAEGDNAPYEESRSILSKALSDKGKEVWAHNLKFESMVCRAWGLDSPVNGRCSQIAQWLLGKGLSGARGHGLKSAVKEYLKKNMTEWSDILTPGIRAHEVPIDKMAPYCSDDALRTLQLGELWVPELAYLGLLNVFETLECPFIDVLVHMREVGFEIDRERLISLSREFSKEESRLADSFFSLTGVNISSNAKISRRLYEELKWWPSDQFTRLASGVFSVDQGHREKLQGLIKKGTPGWMALQLKSQHAGIAKLNSTYTLSLVRKADENTDGKLRCEFKQYGTSTGRLSSATPNFQNIPSKGDGVIIREAFIAEEGWKIGYADYSGADLVMMAHLSRDERMLELFNRPDKKDRDLHRLTADLCGCDRPTGKVLNLGLIYEMMPGTLARNLGCSFQRAKMIHERWHDTYSGVQRYHAKVHAYVEKYGYVRTITGRLRYIPEVTSKEDYKRFRGFREAVSTSDQGSVADVIKIAMRNLYREWKSRGVLYDYWTRQGKAKIQNQVHDELGLSFRDDFAEEGLADLQRHMENAVKLRAPMVAEPGLGRNWLEAKRNAG